MKKLSLVIMTALVLLTFSNAFAQYVLPKVGYGIDVGFARGDNAGSRERAGFIVRGDIQLKIAEPLLAQIGLGYTHLKADINTGGYDTGYNVQPVIADARLLIAPIRMDQMFPFLYVGFGASKDMSANGGGFLPFVPIGVGIQSKIGPQLMLKANIGYNLVLSDYFDHILRDDDHLNRFTNGKQDGYAEILFGIVYTGPSSIKDK